MGVLECVRSGERCLLESHHVIGRSSLCSLQVKHLHVSAEHAAIDWTGDGWTVRDLSSRNGTFLDGIRVSSRAAMPLVVGQVLSFGKAETGFRFVDDGPPEVLALPLDGAGEPIALTEGMLLLPSQDDPQLTVYQAREGWVAERADGTASIESGDIVHVSGQRYRVLIPDTIVRTATTQIAAERVLAVARIVVATSQHEEHVEVRAELEEAMIDLGARAHHYLLLVLARARIDDQSNGVTDAAAGWRHRDELLSMLKTTPEQLNVMVFRLRQQFAKAGFLDAAELIERRGDTGEIRVGIDDVVVHIL